MQHFWQDISDFIFVENDIQPVDGLIIPGAPWIELIQHAADLYHKGIAEKICACGKYGIKSGKVNIERLPQQYQREYKTESEMIKTILVNDFHIPSIDIIEEATSMNTYENAVYGMQKIKHLGWNTIGICCQSFHARRVQMTFESVAPSYRFLIFPTNTQGIKKNDWFESDYGITRVLGELERCGKYFPMKPTIA